MDPRLTLAAVLASVVGSTGSRSRAGLTRFREPSMATPIFRESGRQRFSRCSSGCRALTA